MRMLGLLLCMAACSAPTTSRPASPTTPRLAPDAAATQPAPTNTTTAAAQSTPPTLATTPAVASTPPSPVGSAERGRTLYERQGCAACHSLDGTPKAGPTWKGVWGTEETLTDGQIVLVDEAYVTRSILDPAAQLVDGFPGAMPSYRGVLGEADIADLIAFMKSVK